MPSAPPLVSVVIPVHNAESHIRDTCVQILDFLRDSSFELILVENGSRDDSIGELEKVKCDFHSLAEISIIRTKAGLGNALHEGIRRSRGQIVYLTGDDLPFGIDDLRSALSIFDFETMYIGSKLHPRSSVKRGPKRNFLSKVFSWARIVILKSSVRDSQGTFVVPGEILRSLNQEIKEEGWLYTTELVYRAEQQKVNLREVPVHLKAQKEVKSNLKLRDPLLMFCGLFRIRLRGQKW